MNIIEIIVGGCCGDSRDAALDFNCPFNNDNHYCTHPLSRGHSVELELEGGRPDGCGLEQQAAVVRLAPRGGT